jgi:menaquinone-9 beta-reductase
VNAKVTADVLIVGSGPAGAVTAIGLARRGMRVLVVDPDAGLDAGSRDVLVTGPALRGLELLNIPLPDPLRRADVVELRFGAGPVREIPDSGAAVCDWRGFLRALRRAAAESGARFLAGTVTSLGQDPGGYRAEIGRAETVIIATHAVVACGSGRGPLAPDGVTHSAGMACAQRFTGTRLGGRVVFSLAEPSAIPDDPPTCAWALPGGDGIITVGAAKVGDGGVRPAELLGTALGILGADARFTDLQPAGPLAGGPLDTGYAPARVRQAMCILAGDAAGLANPFTGEGLSYAVQSGLIAVRVIAANPSDPVAARRTYARRLAATFVGYFETARHAARRYHLAWRILAAGADSEHPFFAKGRRAILLPEGFGGLVVASRMEIARPDAVPLAAFLAACDEVAITVVRDEWPFLGRLAMAGETLGHTSQRPAIAFFAALMAAGRKPDITRATLGAAIELALLGAIALLGPVPPAATSRGIDWALTSAVLAGDFLLAQASRLIARSAPGMSWSFGDWLAELTALRAARLSDPPGVPAAALFGSLLEFPTRIGAQLGGGSPEIVRALRDFGQHCGYAFAHAEDILALRGGRTRLDTTLAVMLRGKFSGVPDYLDGMRVNGDRLASDSALRSRALDAAMAACRDARQRALGAIAIVPDPAARILREFAETVAVPVSGSFPDRPLSHCSRPGSRH